MLSAQEADSSDESFYSPERTDIFALCVHELKSWDPVHTLAFNIQGGGAVCLAALTEEAILICLAVPLHACVLGRG